MPLGRPLSHFKCLSFAFSFILFNVPLMMPICAPSIGKQVRMITSTSACSASLVAVKGYGAGVYSAMTQLKEILGLFKWHSNSS